ncbi:MAG: endonuclease/exonuclease/phosphatase family protein [Chlamydiota bacterium]|nr:endonuclease/exonuclease/phosphatase family protein [Chlamydiota bacterium]
MKIICLNVEGGAGNKERFENLIRFVQKEQPDVLGLLELVDWDKNDFVKLKNFLDRTSFQDYLFCKANSPFHMALFTKKKIDLKVILNEKVGHGLLKIKFSSIIGSITVLLTHLTPGSEYARLREVKVVLRHVPQDDPVILMGDFNSLAIHDSYDVENLLAVFKELGIRKFGENEIIRLVIPKIIEYGFEDSAVLMKSAFIHTVPTLANQDQAHAFNLRLDYIFCTKSLASYLKQYQVIQNPDTNKLSDHYPVMTEFIFKHE